MNQNTEEPELRESPPLSSPTFDAFPAETVAKGDIESALPTTSSTHVELPSEDTSRETTSWALPQLLSHVSDQTHGSATTAPTPPTIQQPVDAFVETGSDGNSNDDDFRVIPLGTDSHTSSFEDNEPDATTGESQSKPEEVESGGVKSSSSDLSHHEPSPSISEEQAEDTSEQSLDVAASEKEDQSAEDQSDDEHQEDDTDLVTPLPDSSTQVEEIVEPQAASFASSKASPVILKTKKQEAFRNAVRNSCTDGNSLVSFGDSLPSQHEMDHHQPSSSSQREKNTENDAEETDSYENLEETIVRDDLVGRVVGGFMVEWPSTLSLEPSGLESSDRLQDPDGVPRETSALSQLERDILAKDISQPTASGSDGTGMRPPPMPTSSALSQLERDMITKGVDEQSAHQRTRFVLDDEIHSADDLSEPAGGREDYLAKRQVLSHIQQRNKISPQTPRELPNPSDLVVHEDVPYNRPLPTIEEILITPPSADTRDQIFTDIGPTSTVESLSFSDHGHFYKGPSFYEEEQDGVADHNLVVATVVNSDEMWNRPSALMIEPSSKKGRKYSLYRIKMILFTILLLAILGTIVGVRLATSKSLRALPYRETIGIQETLAQTVGAENINNRSSPYFHALKWIANKDPMALTPSDPGLTQRFLLAYFYFAKADRSSGWGLGCDPLPDPKIALCNLQDRFVRDTPEYEKEILSRRWLSGASECEWAGVECDGLGQVKSLSIRWATVQTSEIPPGLGNLPFLTSFVSIGTNYVGDIPIEILKSKALVELDLPHNLMDFNRNVSSVFQMRSIKYLDLGDNAISGTLDDRLGQASNLKSLKLSNNKLSGVIPEQIADVDISHVILSHNTMNGTLPASLMSSVPSLEFLLLESNRFTGTIPSFGNLPVMDWINFGYNLLTGSIPDTLFSVSTMTTVNLQGNSLTGTLSNQVGNLQIVNFLYFDSNLFTGTIPAEVGTLDLLLELDLRDNDFDGTMPEQVCEKTDPSLPFPLEYLLADCRPSDKEQEEIVCFCCSLCCDENGEGCV